MKMLKEYSIPFKGLKEGSHFFDYNLDDRFFKLFEYGEIQKGQVQADVELKKYSRHMELIFTMNGRVEVSCDRCLDPFEIPLESENQLFVNFGDEHNEDDDEIIVLLHSESELNIAQYLYEFAHLGLPIQRIHPEDEEGNSTCNSQMLEILENLEVKDDEESVDPRWKDLNDLLNNN